MVRERIVVYAIVDFAVWVARTFSAELPYRPVFAMFRVEELYEGVEGVSIRALWVGAAGA